MTVTVCFDALGTCFTLADIVQAVERQYGDQLKAGGWGAKGLVNDWFHSAQRDYTYLSLISPPPPAIASILKTNLPLALSAALGIPPPPSSSLEGIASLLSSLPPAPTLKETFALFNQSGAKTAIVTNGAQRTTERYAEKAGIAELVDKVLSCDEVGLAKPHREVYEAAHNACDELESEAVNAKAERWFVAAHIWDLAAAKKAGFKTALVLQDLPAETVNDSASNDQLKAWYETYSGRPDIVARTLLEIAEGIVGSPNQGREAKVKADDDDQPGPRLTGEEGQFPPDRATLLVI